MRTKEEILEHLKTTSYNCVGNISSWLRSKKVIDTDEGAYFYMTIVGGHTFDDFLAWVDQPSIKAGDYVHVVVPDLGEDWHSIVTGIHKDVDGWRFKTCHPDHLEVSYPIRYATKESKSDNMKSEDKESFYSTRKDYNYKFCDTMNGAVPLEYMDNVNIRNIIPLMDLSHFLSSTLPEEEKDEPAYKAGYIVLYNNTGYKIDADNVKEFSDALCFFEGEDKVALFPPKTPWIKI